MFCNNFSTSIFLFQLPSVLDLTFSLNMVHLVYRYDIGDWVKFKRCVTTPSFGWQGAKHKSVGFVQNVLDKDNLIVSFCSGEGKEARVLTDEVVKVIPLDRGHHVRLKPDVKEPR